MKHIAFGVSDAGGRPLNEDGCIVDPSLGIYLVCDGTGGEGVGDRASAIVVNTIHMLLKENEPLLRRFADSDEQAGAGPIVDLLMSVVQTACRRLYAQMRERPGSRGMCTLSMMVLVGRFAVTASVGDCRIYLIREEAAHQVTDDHVRMMATRDQPERPRKVIMRAVGMQEDVEVDTLVMELMPRDMFLLCSDGISSVISAEEIRHCLSATPLDQAPRALIDVAVRRGVRDNATAVAVRVETVRMNRIDPAQQIKILRGVPLFQSLEYREMMKLCDIIRVQDFQPGEVIVREGDNGRDLYVILAGKVRVTKLDQLLAELPPGSFFGEGSLLDATPRAADVTAIDAVKVMVIRRSDLFALLDIDAPICTKVLWAMCQMLNQRLRKTSTELSWLKQST